MLQDLPMLLFGSTPPNTPHCLFHSPAMLSSSRNTQRAWGRSQEPPDPILIRYTPSTEKAWSNLFVKRSPCPGAVGSMGRHRCQHRCQRSRAPPRPGMHREPAWLWAQAAAGTPPTAQPSARGPPGENYLFKKKKKSPFLLPKTFGFETKITTRDLTAAFISSPVQPGHRQSPTTPNLISIWNFP